MTNKITLENQENIHVKTPQHKIFVDTSSIIYGFKNGKNIFDIIKSQFPRYKPFVSKGIIKELNTLSHNKGKKGVYAKLSLEIVNKMKITIDNNTMSGDRWLLYINKNNKKEKGIKIIIVTNDTILAKKLKSSSAIVTVLKLSKNGILRKI